MVTHSLHFLLLYWAPWRPCSFIFRVQPGWRSGARRVQFPWRLWYTSTSRRKKGRYYFNLLSSFSLDFQCFMVKLKNDFDLANPNLHEYHDYSWRTWFFSTVFSVFILIVFDWQIHMKIVSMYDVEMYIWEKRSCWQKPLVTHLFCIFMDTTFEMIFQTLCNVTERPNLAVPCYYLNLHQLPWPNFKVTLIILKSCIVWQSAYHIISISYPGLHKVETAYYQTMLNYSQDHNHKIASFLFSP